MQKTDTDSDSSSPRETTITAAGVLEDPYKLTEPNCIVFGTGQLDSIPLVELGATIYTNGKAVAVLEGDINRVEGLVDATLEDPPFNGLFYRFRSLRWTHVGSLLRLQGETIFNILGPSVCLLSGRHRPLWDPHSGMDDVRLLTLDYNPRGLSTIEVFQLAKRLGF